MNTRKCNFPSMMIIWYLRQTDNRKIKPTSLTDAGGELKVDEGFNIEDNFFPHHVRVNMSSIFKKKNLLSQMLLHKDRKVASKIVHIERIICCATLEKNYYS